MKSEIAHEVDAYFELLRQAELVRLQVARSVADMDRQYRGCEIDRRLRLKELQREFYIATLSNQLFDEDSGAGSPVSDQRLEAEAILDKKGYLKGARGNDRHLRRTAREERLYGALRQRWNDLTKSIGVRAIDSRGG